MTTAKSDAEIGSLYRTIHKTECLRRKRENDARQTVAALRLMADCFDPDQDHVALVNVSDSHFVSEDGGEIKEKIPHDFAEIVADTCRLRTERVDLKERLSLLVGCA